MNEATVIAQATQSLIGSLWITARSKGLFKPTESGGVRKLWTFWDEEIPLPNLHTAPFWLLACEPATKQFRNHGSQDFTFVPPISTPLSYANIPDAGYDRFVTPLATPIITDARRFMSRHDRAEMKKLQFDHATPVAHYRFGKLTLRTYPIAATDAMHEDHFESTWQERKVMTEFLGVAPLTPNCPMRLFNLAGTHMQNLIHYGMFLRGDYEGKNRKWVDGSVVMLEGSTFITKMPVATMGLWFGFKIAEAPSKAIFDWCRAYVQHRDSAIEALNNPDSYAGIESHLNELTAKGMVGEQGLDGKPAKVNKAGALKNVAESQENEWLSALAGMSGE